jgi:hypothetical protein
MDTDGDRVLTVEEFGIGRARESNSKPNDDSRGLDAAIVAKFDSDGDGLLNLEEYRDVVVRLKGKMLNKLAFDAADHDKDGKINKEEMLQVSRSLFELNIDAEAVQSILDIADMDNDGLVTFRDVERLTDAFLNGPRDFTTASRIDVNDFLDAFVLSLGFSKAFQVVVDNFNKNADPDGTVSLERAAELFDGQISLLVDVLAVLIEGFGVIDGNGDEFLSFQEFNAIANIVTANQEALGVPHLQETDTTLSGFLSGDIDGDMRLNFEEYLRPFGALINTLDFEALNVNPFRKTSDKS